MAAQAAAGALGSMSGPGCQDFVFCAEPRLPGEALGDGSFVQVEATLLVLRTPAEGRQAARAAAASTPGKGPHMQQYGVGPAMPLPPREQPPPAQRLPASSWNMLSAMAGGSVAAPASTSKPAPPGLQQEPPLTEGKQGRSLPNFFGGGGGAQQQTPVQSEKPAASSSAAQQEQRQQRVPVQRPGSLKRAATAATAAAPQPDLAEQQDVSQLPMEQQRLTTVGDYLVNSLTAQSLDLPPAVRHRWVADHCQAGFFKMPCLSHVAVLVALPLDIICNVMVALAFIFCVSTASGGTVAAGPSQRCRQSPPADCVGG